MSRTNEQLLNYVREQVRDGVPVVQIRKILLDSDWPDNVVSDAFSELGISMPQSVIPPAGAVSHEHIDATEEETDMTPNEAGSFMSEGITMDKIIEKFIPIAGALFLIVGFGYLIYANAWVNLSMEIRLGLGFFFSVAIIGASFSFSEKMRYFADIGIGSGVLLLYATLIYGSRTTEAAQAMIPEVVTLITAAVFTIAICYFASKRNSKVILILGMIGAYITPFVIGQNDVWAANVSFNAYLMYFFAVNVSIFMIGKEISVRDIIPLNIIGLFIGVSTLWGLAASNEINAVEAENFFTSEVLTAVLFAGLVIFSIWSVLLSATRFKEKDDGFLSLGYIAPVVWFAYNVTNLDSVADVTVGALYALIAAACFTGWHVLLGNKTRFQHTAIYAAGLLSAFLAVFALFQEFTVYTSMLIAYTSLIFGFLYVLDPTKSERFISYLVVSFTGSFLALTHILDADLRFETLHIVIALVPAMSAYAIAKYGKNTEFSPIAAAYSIVAGLVALVFVAAEFLEYIDVNFLLFYIIPLIVLLHIAYKTKVAPVEETHNLRSRSLRLALIWFAFSFIGVFFYLIVSIYPAPTDTYIFTHTDLPVDWMMIKAIFATLILFVGLYVSRKLQLEQVVRRPSFILVIFSFTTLLLTGNYIISAIMNDLEVGLSQGGPRAIATTLWWAGIAIYMLYVGLRLGKKYHAEKLLGLLLLGITVIKVILYDIATMEMQNKIIVLMLVGGAMLLFSYFVRSKNMLSSPDGPPVAPTNLQ